MNPVDIAVFAILIAGFIWGFSKGFIYMIFSLLAIIAGVFASGKLAPLLMPYLFGAQPSQIGYIVIFIVIFIIIYFIVKKLTYLVLDMVEFLELEWLDSLLGGVIGLAQFLIIAGVLVNLAQGTGLLQLVPQDQEIRFAYVVSTTSRSVIDYIAGNLGQVQIPKI